MKKKTLYTAVAIAVLFVGGFLIYSNYSNHGVKTDTTDSVKMGWVKTGTQQADGTLHYESDLGFSFDYPSDMFVLAGADEPRIFILPNSYKTDHSVPMSGVVISAMENDLHQTPMQWLSGPNSGADMKKGYAKVNVGGQEAIAMNDDVWVVVNTPDNSRQLSIATLPSTGASKELQTVFTNILSSLVFTK